MNNRPTTPCPIEIIKSTTRKSIGIQVYPDCTVKVRAPKWLSQKKIDKIIEQKQDWINKKIENFQQNKKYESQPKKYVDGESFYYLGRQYTLRIIESKSNSVERTDNTIFVYKSPKRNAKNILTKWFLDLANEVFEERLNINFEIFSTYYQYSFPSLKIKTMKARWGSMSSNGFITLNSHLIHTPIECIDYVIMHELCHLKYQNHGREFHLLQRNFTPKYKEIKKNLEDFNYKIRLM
jgi:predicted metal-dependent hydrolase